MDFMTFVKYNLLDYYDIIETLNLYKFIIY